MKIFMRVYHSVSSNSRASHHVMSVIDSDYDEDDEYNQCEIDEIFSISPTGEEINLSQDLPFNQRGDTHGENSGDFYGCDGSEFDSEEILNTHSGIISKNHFHDDDEDDDDDIDYCPSSSGAAVAATNAFK